MNNNTDYYQTNLTDFRKEWIQLCKKSNKLQGHNICVLSSNKYLKEAVETAFVNHGGHISECEESDRVVLFSSFEPSDYRIPENAKIILVEDKPYNREQSLIIHTHLLCPEIIGVGLTDEYPELPPPSASEIKGIFVSDLIKILIRIIHNNSEGFFYIDENYEPDETWKRIEYKPTLSVQTYSEICKILNENPNRRFYFDNGVDGKLHQLQQLQLTCLIELDRICKENNIKYFLCGGTLIGAIREGGFIPWDDDIDVIMDRENFNKLKNIAPKALNPGFFYQDSESDPSYHSPFAKIRLLGTTCATTFSSQFTEMHNEVFIDIFAQDKACLNPKICKFHFRLVGVVRTMVFDKWSGKTFPMKRKHYLLRLLINFIIRHTSIKNLEKIRNSVLTFWNNSSSNLLYDSMGVPFRKESFPQDYFSESIDVTFEGRKFPAPKGFDPYLKINYGDSYMEWPIPSKRKNHHSYVDVSLNVDKGYTIEDF